MALKFGSEKEEDEEIIISLEGMSLAIYQEMDRLLSPPLQRMVDEADEPARDAAQAALDGAREGWKKVAYAIAKGVVNHIVKNMEIFGITVQGEVPVQGNTGSAEPNNHSHRVNLKVEANNVLFTQNNNGTGRVR